MLSDGQLLRRYVDEGSEPAFTELVQRHVNLVYHAALRRVGRNAHSADDVTQKVFSQLARKAKSLQDHPNLAGWLYTSTRFAAADAVRGERRRRAHEREAQIMKELDSPSPEARHLESFLDEAMDLLEEQDRDAVLLHFFKGLSFVEVGAALSLSADAARMRVNRALQRLRTDLAKRGVASSTAALTAVLSTQSSIAAPAPLAGTVAFHAISQAGAGGASGVGPLIRSHPFLAWGGASVAIVVTGLVFYSSHPKSTGAPPSVEVQDIPSPITEPPASSVGSVGPSTAPDARTEKLVSPVTRSAPTREEFAMLGLTEKNILARLWYLHESGPPAPGYRWSLKIGPLAPNFAGRAPLLAKGWVKTGAKEWSIFLTKAGAAFCAAHQEEIKAYSPAPGPAPLSR